MKIDLKNLNGNYDASIPFSGAADLREESFYGDHPFRQPAVYSGEVTNHFGILRLTGTIKTVYSTCCARCLKPLEIPLEARADTLLTQDPLTADSEEDVFLLSGNEVEAEDILVPALFLQIEMAYLCDPDCKGLCPHCGIDRNTSSCSCGSSNPDPRLAILETLLK